MRPEEQRLIGRLEAKIESLESRQDAIIAELQTISKSLSEARGGLRTFLAVGGFSGAAGAFIIKALPFLNSLPK